MGNNRKNSVDGKVTRRAVLQFMAVGIITVAAGLQVAYRCLKPKNKLGVTEITIEGPFKKGYFAPENFGQKYKEKITADFKLLKIIFDTRRYFDQVIIVFTFAGEEKSNRKIKVMLTLYDGDGNEIGGIENIFDDPRMEPTENLHFSIPVQRIPESSLSMRLTGSISRISRLEIFAIDVHNV